MVNVIVWEDTHPMGGRTFQRIIQPSFDSWSLPAPPQDPTATTPPPAAAAGGGGGAGAGATPRAPLYMIFNSTKWPIQLTQAKPASSSNNSNLSNTALATTAAYEVGAAVGYGPEAGVGLPWVVGPGEEMVLGWLQPSGEYWGAGGGERTEVRPRQPKATDHSTPLTHAPSFPPCHRHRTATRLTPPTRALTRLTPPTRVCPSQTK